MSNTYPLIDLKFGLSQLGGNETLLHKMLGRFMAEFSPVPDEVTAHINAGEIKEAKIKVHTTKGISGNLGLSAMYQCAKLLDQQIKENSVQSTTVDEFMHIMKQTCAAIASIESEEKQVLKSSKETSNSDNTQYSKGHLIDKLQRHEFIDEDELEQSLQMIDIEMSIRDRVKDAIESLDYDTALTLLNQ